MNPRSYRTPIDPAADRIRCPVCHLAVYSRAGIHPQCAVRQADLEEQKSRVAIQQAAQVAP